VSGDRQSDGRRRESRECNEYNSHAYPPLLEAQLHRFKMVPN
jgi:hypothetical protein